MGKTFKRNGYHKPKQHGKIFEKKKPKWGSKKDHTKESFDEQPSYEESN